MKYKCHSCDTKKLKELKLQGLDKDKDGKSIRLQSIDTEKDSYLKINGRYYHEECFRNELIKKGKMSKEEIDNMIIGCQLEQRKDKLLAISKNRFYEWIKEHYQVTLPNYYCMRIDKITQGRDERVYGSISYDEFLEMYSMLVNYLAKQTLNKKFKNTSQRMNYELAIVISKYEDYKNYKEKLEEKNYQVVDIKSKIESSNKFNQVVEKARKDAEDFRVADIHDELI
ncbi:MULTISPECIES: hypothetical protein [Lysinibacillus]|uniref:hypothetical protein n=1 Tax=Lysinibacillus TaxID=400634 RepID=UPI00214AED39|nr:MULTISPECIES: hypothetical protein [Lysinibacillus]UUV25971.1 hypothetical protein NP781_04950 [Lysinibacillus sp. FN11]UYB48844.1 hypothetical protein OCI51_07740 [Lysinibacillus capsici]